MRRTLHQLVDFSKLLALRLLAWCAIVLFLILFRWLFYGVP